MKKILVPVGTMESGVNNLRYAIDFATITGATVYVVNIYREFSKVAGLTKVNELMMQDSADILANLLAQVDIQEVEVIAKPIKGDPFEAISRISKQLQIDLIILSPQSVEIKDEVYLGHITGKIVKQTDIPLLIVPKDYLFRKPETILLAFKRGYFEKENVLAPLKEMAQLFNSKINLLHVITPDVAEDDTPMDPELLAMQSSFMETENATIFQGVLEHFQSHHPDMLCVLRRKRGFFQKLLEKNSILKKEFHTSKPLLILKGQE
ncbi:MAG: universal stress protein [Bacteroidetes bacterium]|nr:MAG: universal stress protein [Bacteroidota bacterium]